MKHTYTLFASVLLLSACASPTPDPSNVVEINRPAPVAPAASAPLRPYIDEDCAKLAKFARSIASMRDAGVAIEDVHLLITNIPDFQIGPVIREVYTRKDIAPDAGATNSYKVCTDVGYQNMVAALDKAEADNKAAEQAKIQAAIAAKKTKKPAKVQPQKSVQNQAKP